MNLNEVMTALKSEIVETMSLLVADYPLKDIAGQVNALSRLFESLGICYLLVEGNRFKYQENLVHSGNARIYFLERASKESLTEDRRLGLSRSNAIFDVLAAGQIQLAVHIDALSTLPWKRAWEYEDDYVYFLVVHGLVGIIAGTCNFSLDPLVHRFEKILDGEDNGRLKLCRSILKRDPKEFKEAIELFLRQRITKLDSRITIIASAEADYWPRRFVSVEGLAWLNMAEHFGVSMNDLFDTCPTDAKFPFNSIKYPNFFQEIQSII